MPLELTPEESAFFNSGDIADLKLAEPPAAPAAPVETPAAPTAEAPPGAPGAPAVDHTAELLAAERSRAEQMAARLAEMEAKLKDLSTPPAPQAPDPMTDPLGNMMHQLNSLKEAITQMQQTQTQAQQQASQQQKLAEFVNSVRGMRDEYAKTVPDFNDAYGHMRNVRTEYLQALGHTRDQIAQMLAQEELNFAYAQIQQGKNPADVLYKTAKLHGYTPKQPPAAPASDDATKLEALQKGLVTGAPNTQKAGPVTEFTVEGLKAASDTDLDRLVTNDKEWNKLMGGGRADIFRN